MIWSLWRLLWWCKYIVRWIKHDNWAWHVKVVHMFSLFDSMVLSLFDGKIDPMGRGRKGAKGREGSKKKYGFQKVEDVMIWLMRDDVILMLFKLIGFHIMVLTIQCFYDHWIASNL